MNWINKIIKNKSENKADGPNSFMVKPTSMFGKKEQPTVKYPGKRMALDGNTAAIMVERESTDAAGAYPITPSTQMGEYWAEAAAAGHLNISDRPLIFIEHVRS